MVTLEFLLYILDSTLGCFLQNVLNQILELGINQLKFNSINIYCTPPVLGIFLGAHQSKYEKKIGNKFLPS